MILDIVEFIECRALQDLKRRVRVKLPGGVFLMGKGTAKRRDMADEQASPMRAVP